MLQSMTGFGKAACEFNSRKISVEIRSLNGKSQDLTLKVAPAYREKELEIRNKIVRRLERGKIEFTLAIDSHIYSSALLNAPLVESYFRQIKAVSESLGMEIPANWLDAVIKIPDVIRADSSTIEQDEWEAADAIIDSAIDQLVEFRVQEGKMLADIFTQKIDNIRTLLQDIEAHELARIEKVRTRIEENLNALNEKIDFDRNRFEQELIYYIEKLDVGEEKSRLANHLDYFMETMTNEVSAGKKLGFIAQEIGREINTLGSKANHSAMQKIVVMMKDELEQVKEQVLNVL